MKQNVNVYMGFLDTIHCDLIATETSKNQIKTALRKEVKMKTFVACSDYNLSGPTLHSEHNHYTYDPVTGFLSFPSFFNALAKEFPFIFQKYGAIGVAIGDVDNLKSCFQSVDESNPWEFGHLAGNAFMAQLGKVGLSAFKKLEFPWGMLSTFGGDEIILVSAGKSLDHFHQSVESLHRSLAEQLPLSVSFAAGWFIQEEQKPLTQQDGMYLSASLISIVDRALLEGKNYLKSKEPVGHTFVKKIQPYWLKEGKWCCC